MGADRLRFGILGPLRVWVDGEQVPVHGARQQRVLAVLLLDANLTVPVERLVDAIWDGDPPATSGQQLQSAVSALRRLLRSRSGQDVIATDRRGYTVRLDAGQLDAIEFDLEVAAGRAGLAAGDPRAPQRLRAALAHWRGSALDGLAGRAIESGAAALDELRLSALEECLGAELAAGQHLRLVPELAALVQRHPQRERLVGFLMTALHRSGRQVEALAAYRRLRAMLADEYGLEPGAPIRELHELILRDELPASRPSPAPTPLVGPPAVPRELPAGLATFTGRAAELAALDRSDAEGRRLVVITGTAGVGKTALAVQWAHRVAERFPDGQLYVDLRGHDHDPPRAPAEVLARFLRALGTPTAAIPTEEEERSAAYRSLTGDRRLLVILDNAGAAAQVVPLLPGSPSCAVLVTSRGDLPQLTAARDAVPLVLRPLPAGDAAELLARLLGADRTGAEPAATAELARRCAGLPLALRVAAADLASRPDRSIGRSAAALTAGADSTAAVTAALDLSYTTLPPAERLLFRRLALVPGADAGAAEAAALCGTTPAGAAADLDRLAAAHLVEAGPAERYQMHALLRGYAEHRCAAEPDADRHAARCRLAAYYVDTARAAAALVAPEMLRLPLPGRAAPFEDAREAAGWLATERRDLVAAALSYAASGEPALLPPAWLLADAVRGDLLLGRHRDEWLTIAAAGLAAAERAGDVTAQAAMHNSLGTAHWTLGGDHPRATRHLTTALRLFQQTGNPVWEAGVLANLASVHRIAGRLDYALAHATEALDRQRKLGARTAEAAVLTNLGATCLDLGRLADGRDYAEAAAELYAELGSLAGEETALATLSAVERVLGQLDAAVAHAERATEIAGRTGARFGITHDLECLAHAQFELGRYAEAEETASRALAEAEQTANTAARAAALGTLARVVRNRHRLDEAMRLHGRALATARDAAIARTEATVLIDLAGTCLLRGQLRAARRHAEDGHALARHGGLAVHEGEALGVLGMVTLAQDDPETAIRHCLAATHRQRATGHLLGEARSRTTHGHALARLGDATGACRQWRAAAGLVGTLPVPEAGALRGLLSGSPAADAARA
jgi:DNA-binding SARP family transcriptional activator/tetratricopeptide (TPR) repeat protein